MEGGEEEGGRRHVQACRLQLFYSSSSSGSVKVSLFTIIIIIIIIIIINIVFIQIQNMFSNGELLVDNITVE